jgi:hypothetical protein
MLIKIEQGRSSFCSGTNEQMKNHWNSAEQVETLLNIYLIAKALSMRLWVTWMTSLWNRHFNYHGLLMDTNDLFLRREEGPRENLISVPWTCLWGYAQVMFPDYLQEGYRVFLVPVSLGPQYPILHLGQAPLLSSEI